METVTEIFGTVTSIVGAVAVLAGCAQAPAVDDGAGPSTADTVALARDPARTARVPRSVGLDVPAEWTKQVHNGWTVYQGPDDSSLVAITALLTDDAIPAKLAEGAAAVGATDVHTDTEQAVKLGLHQLPARAADGTCKLGTAPGRIGYAIVELEGERVLILHVAPRSAGDDALRAGRKLVASLKKL